MIVSEPIFRWFVISMIWAISAGWAAWDLYLLGKKWPRRKEIPDEIFGCLMGIALGGTGVVALICFHLGM